MALSSVQDRLGLAFYPAMLVEVDILFNAQLTVGLIIQQLQKDGEIFGGQLILWKIRYIGQVWTYVGGSECRRVGLLCPGR